MRPCKNPALLLVDLQNDFFPGGALPAPEGDSILEPVNRLIEIFTRKSWPVFATRDWHTENHCSFQKQGGPWPPHCIRGTEGAAFHSRVRLPAEAVLIHKAQSPDKDAYSGFEGTDLLLELRQRDIDSLAVGGLVTEICVKNTVIDALKEGFEVTVVREAVSGVEKVPGDSEKALRAMEGMGARIHSIDDFLLRTCSDKRS